MIRFIPLIIGYLFLSACQAHEIDRLMENDIPLERPQPGSWRYDHPENSQSLQEYIHSKRIKPDSLHRFLDIKPIGSFSEKQKQQIAACSTYIALFYQLPCRLRKTSDVHLLPPHQRIGYDGQTQLRAGYLLDSILYPNLAPDALCNLALTAQDLFPSDDWNYVFGLASYHKRVSVSSLFRFQTEHYSQVYDQSFLRLIKTVSHETGHMFGLHHCQHAKCVMNGSNSLSELDQIPCRLCAACLQKLTYTLSFSLRKRNSELLQFFRAHALEAAFEDLRADSLLLVNGG